MRQLMDYYFVLCAAKKYVYDHSKDSMSHVVEDLRNFGMIQFAEGVMWIMNKVFGLSKDMLLCSPNEKEGKYILEQVMECGNFGHHDTHPGNRVKSKWRVIRRILWHNMHLFVRYPQEAIWAPIWIVYHKLWKLKHR